MNIYSIGGRNPVNNFKYALKIMRITLFLLFFGIIYSQAATSYSQGVELTLNLKSTSIKEVCQEIEKQSDFRFIFAGNAQESLNKKIDISVNSKNIEEVLESILSDIDLSFQILEDQVVIFQNHIETSSKEVQDILSGFALQQNKSVQGKVVDTKGDPLPGTTIIVVGETRGVITDMDGNYSIEVKKGDKLAFSFIGMEDQIIDVGDQVTVDVKMIEKVDELEEVTIVAFGKQKKESVISSIQTVKAGELRVPSSNLTTAFAGKMAGVISYQTSGEPGQDNAQFFIRGITSFGTGKVDPLILLDNVEITSNDLARLHPDDIESFSILKDATATSLYGARGANGVILVSTKEGKEGKAKIDFRFENSFSSPTQEIELADPITYMKLANEAVLTRDPLGGNPYSQEKIDNTIRGTNPFVYPTVNWMNTLFKKTTSNQRANMNISGGGNIARYYIAGSFSKDNGILNVDKQNNFNNNIDLKKYLLRSNININLSNSTEAVIRLQGTFTDYIGPISGGSETYKNALRVSPVRFPAYYAPDNTFQHARHILFGGHSNGNYLNPYAEMVKGYKNESESIMLAQFELKQDFEEWVKGLTGRLLGNTIRNSFFDLTRNYNPFYYNVAQFDWRNNEYTLMQLNPQEGTEYLSYNQGEKKVSNSFYGEASLTYSKKIHQHNLQGMLVGITRNSIDGNAGSLTASLPKRNIGVSGRFTYDFSNRYFTEFNFGYNGSEKFDKGHRWGFFPSFGIGWTPSNEEFWTGSILEEFSNLRFRLTYGSIGNDEIGSERFFYLSNINIGGGDSFTSGYDFDKTKSGVKINNYPNSEIGWEISYKTNFGIDIGLLKGDLTIMADIFKEIRTNILQPRADVPTSMGLWATPLTNVGKAKGTGFDISIDYNHIFNNDLWMIGRTNFTFAKTKFEFYEEPDFAKTPWRSRIGHSIRQQWGYVAERLFIDDLDVNSSPRQDFGEYAAGDIKYKDINTDGVINQLDMVPIGYPKTPEINYGFGFSLGYKKFDFSVFFQGSGRSSFWLDVDNIAPFIQKITSDGKILETGLAKFISDDYWSESTQNPFAKWPRLANKTISNNNQISTFYMQDGEFLRLKSIEYGYTMPTSISQILKVRSCRIYFSGSNLLLFSRFKIWDVEMGGNGLGYPIQRVMNLGVNLKF